MISRKAMAGLMTKKEKKDNPHSINQVVSNIQQRHSILREAAGGCGQAGQKKCATPRKK